MLDYQRRLRWARAGLEQDKLELQATVSEQHEELTQLRVSRGGAHSFLASLRGLASFASGATAPHAAVSTPRYVLPGPGRFGAVF